MKRVLLIAVLALTPVGALAEPDRVYEVGVTLSDDGATVAAPSLSLAAGGSARMEVAGLYRVTAKLTATADGRLLLETEVSRPDDAEWVVESRPGLTLNSDSEASMLTRSETWDQVRVSIRPAA